MRWLRPLLVAVFLVCAILLFLFWSNCVIQTQTVEVTLAHLPQNFDGLRIVELADLHGRQFGSDNEYLLQAVKNAQPDLICIDGDFFDEDTDLAMLEPLVSGLVDIAPTFYVTGNHEWQVENLHGILKHLEQLGAIVLENEYHTLERDGQKLVIAGVHDPCGPYDQLQPSELVAQIRAAEGEEVCIIMLAHRNDTLPMWAELQVDLVLTGHCHGGVIRLPLLGGVFGTKRELFPEYDAGLYERGQTQLYVSRGLGYTNTRLRLFNRPHLPVLVLRS